MLLERGSLCRTTGSTLMNAHSSRSHAIFTVLLEQRIRPEGEAAVADEKVIEFFRNVERSDKQIHVRGETIIAVVVIAVGAYCVIGAVFICAPLGSLLVWASTCRILCAQWALMHPMQVDHWTKARTNFIIVKIRDLVCALGRKNDMFAQ